MFGIISLFVTIIGVIVSIISLVFVIKIHTQAKEMNDDVWDLVRVASSFITLDYMHKYNENYTDDELNKGYPKEKVTKRNFITVPLQNLFPSNDAYEL